ncbi:MAG TPA: polysaccharide biosynthesis protein, partial [Bryobacteraceae bacterium]|nr:polysaccharide biosynthesis protein [Bryobacteraceae bacterium]
MLRLLAVYAIEAAAITCAAVIAFFLRFDFSIPSRWIPILETGLAVWIPLKLVSFRLFELDRRWARYVSISDMTRLVLSNAMASGVATAVLVAIQSGVPRTIYAIDLLVCICITAGIRVSVRVAAEVMRPKSGGEARKRVLIYGAGDAGVALLRDLRHHPTMNYHVIGFVDDDRRKAGLVLHGARVLGSRDDLPALVRKVRADLVLIAIPSATGAQMKEIIERCVAAGVGYKTIPGLPDLMYGEGLARQIRDVAVEDLLGRAPARLEHERISGKLCGRTILVTGAAGSIGSELCRQIARFRPASIVGFEIAES